MFGFYKVTKGLYSLCVYTFPSFVISVSSFLNVVNIVCTVIQSYVKGNCSYANVLIFFNFFFRNID